MRPLYGRGLPGYEAGTWYGVLVAAGIRMLHVPYKGTGPALNDTIAGHVQMMWGSAGETLPQVKSGGCAESP